MNSEDKRLIEIAHALGRSNHSVFSRISSLTGKRSSALMYSGDVTASGKFSAIEVAYITYNDTISCKDKKTVYLYFTLG